MPVKVRNTTHKMKRWEETNLFVDELSGILFYMFFIQVGGHVHETNLWQPKVCQLNVSQGGD